MSFFLVPSVLQLHEDALILVRIRGNRSRGRFGHIPVVIPVAVCVSNRSCGQVSVPATTLRINTA